MKILKQFPTVKDESEFMSELTSLIRTALKRTSEKRTEGLKLTNEQISKIISKVRKLKLDNNKRLRITLDGIIHMALQDSEEPEIHAILAKQREVYESKQEEFKNSEEYSFAQRILKIYKKYPDRKDEFDNFFIQNGLSLGIKDGKGTIQLTGIFDESRFILSKFDNAYISIENGKKSINILRAKNREEIFNFI